MTDVVSHGQNYFQQELYHRSLKLAVAALASVRAVVWSWLLASFRVRDRKYLSLGFIFIIGSEVTLMFLRAWLVKIRADFGSAQNIQHLHGVFAGTELVELAGFYSLVLVGRKRDRGKTRSSSVDLRDFCSLSLRAHCCRPVSSSVHWKLVSYRFLALVRRQCSPFFWGLWQIL